MRHVGASVGRDVEGDAHRGASHPGAQRPAGHSEARRHCREHPSQTRQAARVAGQPQVSTVHEALVNDPWPRIAVVGAGAVGCYFGGMLARAGAPVTLVGRPTHVDTINRAGLFLDTLRFQERVSLAAATELPAVRQSDVVLFCVKTLDTEDAAKSLAPHLAASAVVLSLQNGVDNVERIRRAAAIEAIPTIVYVAAQMTAPGCVKHTGRGDLVLGDFGGQNEDRLERLAALFRRAGVPCVVSKNIQGELWTKLIMNCAYNPISALSRARYGAIVADPGTRAVMKAATEEAIAVGQA